MIGHLDTAAEALVAFESSFAAIPLYLIEDGMAEDVARIVAFARRELEREGERA